MGSETHIRMPVKLTKRTRLERNDRRSNSCRDGEVPGVNNRDAATTAGDGNGSRSGRVMENVRARSGESTLRSAIWGCRGSGVEDIWILIGDVVKDGDVDAEVLGEDVARGVCDPVINHEGCASGVKVA